MFSRFGRVRLTQPVLRALKKKVFEKRNQTLLQSFFRTFRGASGIRKRARGEIERARALRPREGGGKFKIA